VRKPLLARQESDAARVQRIRAQLAVLEQELAERESAHRFVPPQLRTEIASYRRVLESLGDEPRSASEWEEST
jgi:hypothetical protein